MAKNLRTRLMGAYSDLRTWPQLAHIATDGETYGHHHRHGEMALAYALHFIESRKLGQDNELRRVSREISAYARSANSTRTPPGAVCTAWSAGEAIAAAIRGVPAGIRNGGNLFAMLSIGCAITSHPASRSWELATCVIPGKRATAISMSL